jgi:uncharacterized protein (TIGR03000 family)
MFTPRTARPFGLALTAFALAVGLSSLTDVRARAQEKKAEEKKAEEKKADGKKVRSKIKITLPREDAELKIEGKEMKKVTGVVREFETPDIDAGKPYEYEFEATWAPNNYTILTRTQAVEFKGGDDIVVDLTKPNPKMADKAKIRWVPTPDDIVEEMMKLGKVGKDDVAYEPGPGDGRMLIAAVKKGAKKGVGIEIDAKKAEEARENIKKAKLDKEITIIEGDALKDRDYSEASVVLLYMGNEFNELLRPILEKQLKPGSRIISHRFLMGDWKPDETKTVTGADGDEYLIHVWIVKEKKK